MVQHLEWDSEFFNLKIGKCFDISEMIVNQMYLDNFDLLYVFVDEPSAEQLMLLQENNANLVDSKVVFHKFLDSKRDHVMLSEFKSTDSLSQIVELAIQSGHKSRFKLDENFEEEKFEEMYKIWINKSVNDKSATKVFVYRDHKKLGGFVTVDISNSVGTIGLIAVDESLRGRGIGAKLVKQVESFLLQSNISELEVTTQLDNNGACEFYKQLGFKIKETTNIYHLWKIRMR